MSEETEDHGLGHQQGFIIRFLFTQINLVKPILRGSFGDKLASVKET